MNVWQWMTDKYGYSLAFREWEKLHDLREKAKALAASPTQEGLKDAVLPASGVLRGWREDEL